MTIPIRNLYYLLSYAWNKLEEAQKVEVSLSDYDDALNLLARVFTGGCQLLFKRGLDKAYQPVTEAYPGIKGKIEFNASLSRNTFTQGKAICTYDLFEENILLNQIIKATLRRLLQVKSLDKELRSKVYAYYNRMGHISAIPLTNTIFHQVRLHRNNAFYRFLLEVARLIANNTTIDESNDSSYHFSDFTRNPKQMAALFEEFVRNFYAKEQQQFKVGRENIEWDFNPIHDSDKGLLPKMQTDVSLTANNRKIILDTKYYQETLSQYYDTQKFHSNNLYQLYAYLKNLEADTTDPRNQSAEGILLYPTTNQELDQQYQFGTHTIRILTVNLDSPWLAIHKKLLSIF